MKRDVISLSNPLTSSFLAMEKDVESVLKKLFFDNQVYNKELIRLLVINKPDCLSNQTSTEYLKAANSTTLGVLIDKGYIKLEPKIGMPEHEEVKSYIVISFDNFAPNATNPQFRDCTVHFDIVCHTNEWKMDNYQIRPIKIAGYIDGILNETRLSGIGTFNFMGLNQLVLDETLSGYTLSYRAIHGSDDKISPEE